MYGDTLKVLMVEDDEHYYEVIRKAMSEDPTWPIELVQASSLSQAIKHVTSENYEAILLELNLPDSQGLDTFTQIRAQTSHIPIVVLSMNKDFWFAIQSVREGAQDYLLKGEVNGPLLARALYYAVERNNTLETLRRLSLLDDLTGLYNRRGFLSLGEQQISLAKRSKCALIIVYADVDGLKIINDIHGHQSGDDVLIRTANVLHKTFRRSDIIGRIGGDEFVVLAIDATVDTKDNIFRRMYQVLDEENKRFSTPYELSLSAGAYQIDLQHPKTFENWIAEADRELYEIKRKKKVAAH